MRYVQLERYVKLVVYRHRRDRAQCGPTHLGSVLTVYFTNTIVLHKAKTVLGLFCLQLNTTGWSVHDTSRICKETIDWDLRVYG